MCTPASLVAAAEAAGGGGAGPTMVAAEDLDTLPGPARALIACQFGRWWPKYREHALSPAVVIDLTDEEAEFLVQDGVALGDGDAARALPSAAAAASASSSSSSSSSSSDSDSDSEVTDWTERLPRLASAISSAFASPELSGAPAVVPKLNWSTPWDAAWVLPPAGLLLPAPEATTTTGTTTTTVALSDLVGGAGGSVVVCGNAEQVVLLLQSSDRAAHDLSLVARLRRHSVGGQGGGGGEDDDNSSSSTVTPQLALRSWRPLRPERELRLFVMGHRVVGVSQRDAMQQYEQLRAEVGGGGGGEGSAGAAAQPRRRLIDDLARRACAFHARHVRDTFEVPDYAMDVYVDDEGHEDGSSGGGGSAGVRIVDVNPVAATTSACCFGSWRAVPGGLWESEEYRDYLAAAVGEGDEEEEEDQEAVAVQEEEGLEEQQEQQQDLQQETPPVRFVGDGLGGGGGGGGMWPGQRFACGMPIDVLNMSDWAGGGGGGGGGAGAGAADVLVEAMRRAAATTTTAREGEDDDDDED